MVDNPYTWGLGRRKSSVARVRIKPGSGGFLVNGRPAEEYFPVLKEQVSIHAPLKATETDGNFDVWVNVSGGGHTGQAAAIRHGLSRAMLQIDSEGFRPNLKKAGYLTRDARSKERKKYGQPGARKRYQFSKR